VSKFKDNKVTYVQLKDLQIQIQEWSWIESSKSWNKKKRKIVMKKLSLFVLLLGCI